MLNQVYTFAYSNDYTPAMPIVELGISLPKRSQADVTITALLDSGSDGTMLPVDLLDQIGAKPVGQGQIRGILGHSRPIELYLINCILVLISCTPFGRLALRPLKSRLLAATSSTIWWLPLMALPVLPKLREEGDCLGS